MPKAPPVIRTRSVVIATSLSRPYSDRDRLRMHLRPARSRVAMAGREWTETHAGWQAGRSNMPVCRRPDWRYGSVLLTREVLTGRLTTLSRKERQGEDEG